MKKLIFSLLLTVIVLSASKIEIERKIYTTLFQAIFTEVKHVKIWSDEPSKVEIFKKIKILSIVQDKKEADILMIFHTHDIVDKKIKFVGTYELLKDYQKDAIGGFFWQKGRPNILFLQENLEKYHIDLSNKFQNYIKKKL